MIDKLWPGPGVDDLGSSPTDDLIAGEIPPLSGTMVIIKGGQGVLPRGAVLGMVTADEEFKLTAAAAGDGSEKARVVLTESVDTTGGAVERLVYLTGCFNRNKITVGAGHTAESVYWDLANVGIQLRDTVRA